MEKDSRVDNDRTKHYTVRNIAARLFSQQIFYSENYEQNFKPVLLILLP